MTLAAPAPSMSLRRLQGVLVVGSLVAAVVGTVVLVAPTAGSLSPAIGGGAASSPVTVAPTVAALPPGFRVAVEGGEPFVAYGLADRLSGAGASLGGVRPASSREGVPSSTSIVYYDTESLAAAEEIRAMLGTGTLRRQRVFEPPVDVTIVLGKDLARL